jgi:hypothetical protein
VALPEQPISKAPRAHVLPDPIPRRRGLGRRGHQRFSHPFQPPFSTIPNLDQIDLVAGPEQLIDLKNPKVPYLRIIDDTMGEGESLLCPPRSQHRSAKGTSAVKMPGPLNVRLCSHSPPNP